MTQVSKVIFQVPSTCNSVQFLLECPHLQKAYTFLHRIQGWEKYQNQGNIKILILFEVKHMHREEIGTNTGKSKKKIAKPSVKFPLGGCGRMVFKRSGWAVRLDMGRSAPRGVFSKRTRVAIHTCMC